ncbi:hypothetical protein [Streptomyces somaliensis]|nr:hypothetical protein [Streptomyces somaliensis]
MSRGQVRAMARTYGCVAPDVVRVQLRHVPNLSEPLVKGPST